MVSNTIVRILFYSVQSLELHSIFVAFVVVVVVFFCS